MRARAFAVLRDGSLAEEVAQEVLIEVWQNATRFDPARGAALGWLMTITRRRAIDRVRSEDAGRRRAQDRRAEGHTGGAWQDGCDVVELVIRRNQHALVRCAIAELTAVQAEAIALAFYGGLTYPEVAAALGVPLGTVKSRIREGLRRLGGLLDRPGADLTESRLTA